MNFPPEYVLFKYSGKDQLFYYSQMSFDTESLTIALECVCLKSSCLFSRYAPNAWHSPENGTALNESLSQLPPYLATPSINWFLRCPLLDRVCSATCCGGLYGLYYVSMDSVMILLIITMDSVMILLIITMDSVMILLIITMDSVMNFLSLIGNRIIAVFKI